MSDLLTRLDARRFVESAYKSSFEMCEEAAQRIRELEELVRLPLERLHGWERGDMNPHQAAEHFSDTSHLGPADRLAAAVLESELRAQTRRIQYQREELRRLDAVVAGRGERIRELEQKCEKLREERNAVRVKYEQPLLLRMSELEAALKSATPVYRQTSDTLSEMGVIIEPTVMYYRIDPDVLGKVLETQQ